MSHDALVLTGGMSRRLGRTKTAELVDGRPLVARVTDALVDAQRVIIVGAVDGATRVDATVLEEPPGGGPVAAIAAGLASVRAPVVLTLAGDLPFLTSTALGVLVDAVRDDVDVAVAVDDRGREQFLLAAWRTDALRSAIGRAGSVAGARLGMLITGVQVLQVELRGDPPPWWDCDTEAELAQAREWADPVSRR